MAEAVMSAYFSENNNWLWIGSVIYGFSWVFFGIGFFLAGKEGLKYLKSNHDVISDIVQYLQYRITKSSKYVMGVDSIMI